MPSLRGADRGQPRRSTDADRARRRPGLHPVHRRHHRLPQGRDAQPLDPVVHRHPAPGADADAGRQRARCTWRRCSTWAASAARWCSSSPARRTCWPPRFDAARGAADHRARARHRRAAGAHHAAGADHASASSTASTWAACKRMVYGASPIAEPVLERALALLPGVAFTHSYGMTELRRRDLEPAGEPRRRRPRLGPARAPPAAPACGVEVTVVDANGQRGAARRGRRDHRARPQRDARLLEQARGDRRARCATAGSTPATAAAWTRAATSSSSTA